MFTNVLIKGIGISYPEENISTVDEWREEYIKKGIRIKSMMKMLGKEKSFIADKDADYFTLLENASKEALEDSGLTVDDVDMLVVVTEEPEYLTPTNALKLGSILGANHVKCAYDLNANCCGGVVALDQVSSFLKQHKSYQNALVVCAFYGSFMRDGKTPYYNMFSDSAAAYVLERKEEEQERGVMDSVSKTDYQYMSMNTFPTVGLKNVIVNKMRSDEDILSTKQSADLDFTSRAWMEILTKLFENNGLEQSDIKKYFFS